MDEWKWNGEIVGEMMQGERVKGEGKWGKR